MSRGLLAIEMVRNALGYASLFRALYFAKRSNARRARAEFQTALARLRTAPDFADAFDARISMLEGFGDEARRKLQRSMEKLQPRLDVNGRYITLYCQHFLDLYERSSQARVSKSEASSLSPSGYLVHFLPFFADESISRIINEKGAKLDLKS
ncbi:MAG: hypothetical protein Q8Q53_05255 [Novosphingobium sp.]|nr:hypothetical protein [Novosphingobium sp.]